MKGKIIALLLIAPSAFGSGFGSDWDAPAIPNNINNTITHLRLEALMKKSDSQNKDPLGQNTIGGAFNQDCTLSVGAPTGNGGLLSKPQTIVITGPVINKCR